MRSGLYTIDPVSYVAEREERMTRHLDDFFWKCYFMLRMNRVHGDYLEFGCGSNVRSFRLAYKYMKLEYSAPRLFAFDSFEGLPAPQGVDSHPQWAKGNMAVSTDMFRNIMREMGARDNEYVMVPGFYDKSLDPRSPETYGVKRAAMVFVDCDLYESTVSVLNFVKDILSDGAVLAFDDWFCFNGDPAKGEQRAFSEFREAHPHLRFSEYLKFGWHGNSFIMHADGTM
jgi:hypothetical protein